MKKVAMRSIAALILAALLTVGLGYYVYLYITRGESWATYYANGHMSGSVGASQVAIYDRNNVPLLTGAGEGRNYNEDIKVRMSTLHTVGDAEGNIYSLAMKLFSENSSYDPVHGVQTGEKVIRLSIDSGACVKALEAMGDRRGAVGVYNYVTGEILCLVSTPAFDPADPPDLSKSDEGYEGAYINRFMACTYTPGSVFKLVTAAAAVDTIGDIFSQTFICEGSMTLSGQKIICGGIHGEIDFRTALAKSCNCAFAQIAEQLGTQTLTDYVVKTGVCDSIEFQGVSSSTGQFDLSQANTGDLAWAGIGQYYTLVNPCALMTYMGTIANGGRQRLPSLVCGVVGEDGGSRLSQVSAGLLKEMMANNVAVSYGAENYPGLALCAKSGTAETGGGLPHAWFAGFLDDDAHPYAFVVIAEDSGSGSEIAGPIANEVLQYMVSQG